MTAERIELLWRILVAIVSGIILGVWGYFIFILVIVNFFIVLFTAKRNREIAEFCEYWNSETYRFYRYLTFNTNEKPFPFNPLIKIRKYEK
ncbi:MAG: DUF4389 domain-containing protein [Nanoarchaeota archaeon]|nr:DUF4389 domain-containing protein [Nanoarchaeota archaeon]